MSALRPGEVLVLGVVQDAEDLRFELNLPDAGINNQECCRLLGVIVAQLLVSYSSVDPDAMSEGFVDASVNEVKAGAMAALNLYAYGELSHEKKGPADD